MSKEEFYATADEVTKEITFQEMFRLAALQSIHQRATEARSFATLAGLVEDLMLADETPDSDVIRDLSSKVNVLMSLVQASVLLAAKQEAARSDDHEEAVEDSIVRDPGPDHKDVPPAWTIEGKAAQPHVARRGPPIVDGGVREVPSIHQAGDAGPEESGCGLRSP